MHHSKVFNTTFATFCEKFGRFKGSSISFSKAFNKDPYRSIGYVISGDIYGNAHFKKKQKIVTLGFLFKARCSIQHEQPFVKIFGRLRSSISSVEPGHAHFTLFKKRDRKSLH